MTIANLTTTQLEQILALTKQKDALTAEIAKITQQMESIYNGSEEAPETTEAAAPSAPARRKPGRQRRASSAASSEAPAKPRRGALKEQIVAALKAAGKDGLSVTEVAEQLNANKSSVNVWFYTTGKNIPGLKKIGPGRFALR